MVRRQMPEFLGFLFFFFSPSTVWVPEVELGLSGLATLSFPCQALSPASSL